MVENELSNSGGLRGAEPWQAGNTTSFSVGAFHPTHVLMQTAQYVFCALCGTYGKQLRRTKLHVECPRAPRNRWALIRINELMSGIEPDGHDMGQSAAPYVAD